ASCLSHHAIMGLLDLLRNLFGRRESWTAADTKWANRFGAEELAKRLGVTVEELGAARPSYRESFIPKRGGGKRRILIPDDSLKALQRRVLRRVLARLRTHPAAHGSEPG